MKINKLLQLLRDNASAERRPLNVYRNDESSEATIYLYDVIDPWWGISSEAFAREVAGLSGIDTLHLRVNSPGGDVFEGRAIRTALQQFPGRTVGHIDGLAASAATTVVDGCDEIEIAEGAFYMIHNGWTLGYGNQYELSKTVELLKKVDAAITNDYGKRTGKDVDQIAAWMKEETWFDAAEAIEQGFVNRLAVVPDKTDGASNKGGPGPRNDATWKLGAFDKVPKALLNKLQTSAQTDADTDWAEFRANNARRLRLLELA